MTALFSPEEMAKLPKWARKKVEHLQRQRNEAIRLATVRAGEPTGIRLGYSHGDIPQVYIPDDEQPIYFDVPIDMHPHNRICVTRREFGLRINAISSIVVQPECGNVVSIICQEWIR